MAESNVNFYILCANQAFINIEDIYKTIIKAIQNLPDEPNSDNSGRKSLLIIGRSRHPEEDAFHSIPCGIERTNFINQKLPQIFDYYFQNKGSYIQIVGNHKPLYYLLRRNNFFYDKVTSPSDSINSSEFKITSYDLIPPPSDGFTQTSIIIQLTIESNDGKSAIFYFRDQLERDKFLNEEIKQKLFDVNNAYQLYIRLNVA